MKKVLFFTMALVAGFALTSCDRDSLTPEGDTTKLWVAGEDDSDLMGYIDANGKMVIKAEYSKAYTFCCGWAFVVDESGEKMYIDKNGKAATKVPDTDTYYTSFYYNLITFKEGGLFGKWDNNFKQVIPADYQALGMNSDAGLMWYSEDGKAFGFLAENGTIAINADDAEFAYCSTFSDGLCVVGETKTTDSGTEKRYGIIDEKGNYTLDPQKKQLFNMNEGRVAFYNDTKKKYGIWDKKGEEIMAATYDDMSALSCGLALVEKDNKYGFVDKNGNEVIAPKYYSAADFTDNVAWVLKSSEARWELIDKSGEQVIKLKDVESPQGLFHNGLALIYNSDANEYRYINKKGEVIYKWEPKSSSSVPAKTMREISLETIKASENGAIFIDMDNMKKQIAR